MSNTLDAVKKEKWFYEFTLPDGTKTESYLPEMVRKIHETRAGVLRAYMSSYAHSIGTALDVSCHEGFFSMILSEYAHSVVGIDKNAGAIRKAKIITSISGKKNIQFVHAAVEEWRPAHDIDFVLCFGLLYHAENPVSLLRKLALLTRKAMCVETQILPFQINAFVEDGSYAAQRELKGVFGLCTDYAQRPEGGLTDLALVPSRDALIFLLKQFGFVKIEFYKPRASDYEQFVRRNRVIIFAEKQ